MKGFLASLATTAIVAGCTDHPHARGASETATVESAPHAAPVELVGPPFADVVARMRGADQGITDYTCLVTSELAPDGDLATKVGAAGLPTGPAQVRRIWRRKPDLLRIQYGRSTAFEQRHGDTVTSQHRGSDGTVGSMHERPLGRDPWPGSLTPEGVLANLERWLQQPARKEAAIIDGDDGRAYRLTVRLGSDERYEFLVDRTTLLIRSFTEYQGEVVQNAQVWSEMRTNVGLADSVFDPHSPGP